MKRFVSNSYELSKIYLRHVSRTRLMFVVIVFSFLSQVGGLKLIHQGLSGSVGLLPALRSHQSVFVVLFLELFGGVLLTTLYGIWIVPFLHVGTRAPLTAVLPVHRMSFAVAVLVGLSVLLGVQFSAALGAFGWVLGFEELHWNSFPWTYFFFGGVLEWLGFASITFFFSALSIHLGAVVAFFLGVSGLSVLQLVGVLRALGDFLQSKGIRSGFMDQMGYYRFLPPVGDLAFQLRELSMGNPLVGSALFKWVAWLGLFAALYLLRIGRRARSRIS